ncbi:hypothetical protein [Rhodococcus spelaei]|uniref:hypothetical protein n=1 Tax=Rhodococcus spelaei TaxID=2546320 RepID=UPI0015EF43FE|nr:hypothetical protein [Rhodococcus spelaei]
MAIHSNPTASGRSRGREIALNVGAIAGLICVLAAAASFLFGIKPLIFRSGSMSPSIPTGALALSKATPVADLAVSDVVSVPDQQGTRITHRIKEVVSTDGTTSVLILKGDANKDADISPYTVTEVDRVFFSVPGLGYAVSWLSSPAAIFLGGGLVGGLMVLAFGPASKRKDDNGSGDGSGGPGEHERIEQPAAPVYADAPTEQFRAPTFQLRRIVPARTAMALGAVGLTVLAGSAVGTSAAFVGTNTANSGTFAPAAKLLPAVTGNTCWNDSKVGYSGAVLRWSHIGAPYSYKIIVRRGSSTWNIDVPSKSAGTQEDRWVDSGVVGAHTDWNFVAEIHTVNPAGQISADWVGTNVWQQYTNTVKCNGQTSGTTSGAGFFSAPVPGGGAGAQAANLAAAGPTTTAPQTTTATPTATTTTATPSTTTTSATTAPSTTTTAPATTTTTVPPTTTTTTTTTTVPPTTTTTEQKAPAAPAPAGDLAVANTSTSGNYTAAVSATTATITDKSGAQTFSAAVGKGAIAQWAKSSDQLWIVDGKKLSVVDAATGKQTPVDPSSDTVPADVAALVAK